MEEQRYLEQRPEANGLLASRTFPTLVLPVKPLLEMNSAAVLETLEISLKSPMHQTVVERVAAAR